MICSVYKELKRNLSPLLKLHRLLRREGVTTDKIQWFVNIARIGAYKIRDPEGVCKAERQLEVIDHRKWCQNMNMNWRI